MATTLHLVSIAPEDRGVLIFHTWRKKIPDGIQVLRACGGGGGASAGSPNDDGPEDETLKNVRLGFDSFLAQCSITHPVVSEGQNGYCRVYVNWEVDPARPGYNSWGGGVYQTFMRSLFNETYAMAKIRREGKKVSVRFSDKHASAPVETKIEFAAEKPATAWTPENTTAFAGCTPQLQGTAAALAGPNTLHLPKKAVKKAVKKE